MLMCNEVSRLIASGEAERLGWFKRLELRLHLMMCHHCRRYAEQVRALGQLAHQVWGPHTRDEADLARLEERILREGLGGHSRDG